MAVATSAIEANWLCSFERRSQFRLIPPILDGEVAISAGHGESPRHDNSFDTSAQPVSRRLKSLIADLQDQCSIGRYGLANRADKVGGFGYLLTRLGRDKVGRTTALALRAHVAQTNLECRSIHERMLHSLLQRPLTSVKPRRAGAQGRCQARVGFRPENSALRLKSRAIRSRGQREVAAIVGSRCPSCLPSCG